MLKFLALFIFMSDRADKFKEGVTRYEPHPPAFRTACFQAAFSILIPSPKSRIFYADPAAAFFYISEKSFLPVLPDLPHAIICFV